MKTPIELVTILLVWMTVTNGGPFSGDRIVRVFPRTNQHLQLLAVLKESQSMQLDFWKFALGAGKPVDIHVSSHDYGILQEWFHNNSMPFTVISRDLQTLVDQEHDVMQLADPPSVINWFETYHSYEEINAKIVEIVSKAPDRTSLLTIGKSYEKRTQSAVRITGTPKPNKPVFFMNCGIHAREWITPATCMYIMNELATKYGIDGTITAVLNKIDFIILPLVNPDGYVFSQLKTENRFWRKSRQPITTAPECIGADLNRNFDYMWGLKEGSSPRPCSQEYRGNAPFSEIEVKNIADFLRNLGPSLKGYLDVHAYGQMLMLPWAYQKVDTPDHKELERIGNLMAEAMKMESYTTYQVGRTSKLLYKTSGSTQDYVYGKLGILYTYALELRDKGDHGFTLPQDQILNTATETFAGIKTLVKEMKL